MNGPRQSSRAGDAASIEPRVSTLVGDRLCTKCGYNLTGQPVKREAHYDMLIVRCPECATVASLQEYPLLGRWAGRWAMLLAALWFGFVLLLALASAGILYGEAESVAQAASVSHATHLAERHQLWLKEQAAKGTLPPNSQWLLSNPGGPYQFLDQTWSAQQDFDALLAEAGGWRSAADFTALRQWMGLSIWAVPIGCFWAVALAHVRRRRLIEELMRNATSYGSKSRQRRARCRQTPNGSCPIRAVRINSSIRPGRHSRILTLCWPKPAAGGPRPTSRHCDNGWGFQSGRSPSDASGP